MNRAIFAVEVRVYLHLPSCFLANGSSRSLLQQLYDVDFTFGPVVYVSHRGAPQSL